MTDEHLAAMHKLLAEYHRKLAKAAGSLIRKSLRKIDVILLHNVEHPDTQTHGDSGTP
jgi:hypothetical protein